MATMWMQVFSLWAPTKEDLDSAKMQAFEKQVGEILSDPEAMKFAMSVPAGKARVFADPDDSSKRLFIIKDHKVYRPADWDALEK